jgi:threonine dehydrogenase-like Zn-dependent dehydrogenase
MIYPSEAIIHKVPNELPWEAAVLIEPLSCAVYGVERVGVNLGDTCRNYGRRTHRSVNASGS